MPEKLAPQPIVTWRAELSSEGLGGIAANENFVVLGMRDVLDTKDVFRCYAAATGKLAWQYDYLAEGRLDYGNSPRATPLLHEDLVFLQGAFGHLACLDLETGAVFWNINLCDQFGVEPLTWGNCWSPVVIDNNLIVQPGSQAASLAALDIDTGEIVWQTSGNPAAYSSPVVATTGETTQIIAYDKLSLGGWDAADGSRIWSMEPEYENDFNVPTPIVLPHGLFVNTENNGARIFKFNEQHQLAEKPAAQFVDLASDTHTPVCCGDEVYAVFDGLYCLDDKSLEQLWLHEDDAFYGHASIVASDDKILTICFDGTLILLKRDRSGFKELGRTKIGDAASGIHAHPAFVGDSMYVRFGRELQKIRLADR